MSTLANGEDPDKILHNHEKHFCEQKHQRNDQSGLHFFLYNVMQTTWGSLLVHIDLKFT